jgi:hypothetical protein
MKGDGQVVLFIAFALGGFSVGLVVNSTSVSPFFDNFLTPVATLIAAYGGSKYAFSLQHEQQKAELAEKNVRAANNAIFELVRWHGILQGFKGQFIEELRSDKWRHLLILPAAGMVVGSPKVDYDSISFLYSSKDPNILGRLSMAILEVASTLDVIVQRSKLHVEAAQPAAEAVERRVGGSAPHSEVEKEMGPRNAKVMRMLTDFMVSGVDDSIEALRKSIDELHRETKRLYPGHTVIGMALTAKGSSRAEL